MVFTIITAIAFIVVMKGIIEYDTPEYHKKKWEESKYWH